MNDKKRPLIIGITGGTGSGKSTVCKAIIDNIPEENIATLEQDAYYKDQSHLTFEERLKTNYDHPLSFDNKLLIKHIEELCEGKTIEKPIYDYELHTRKQNETVPDCGGCAAVELLCAKRGYICGIRCGRGRRAFHHLFCGGCRIHRHAAPIGKTRRYRRGSGDPPGGPAGRGIGKRPFMVYPGRRRG